jgi:pimeloyl-ACP methyl ester carboxylesterase
MVTILFVLLVAVLSPGIAYAGAATESGRHQWTASEMNSPWINRAIEDADLMPGTNGCGEEHCKFRLHYFFGAGYNPERKEKTILFISGGPGDIVDPKNRPLSGLEDDYNIVYFDVRGTGLSAIPNSNRYDKYLRARYVVADIERIRQALEIEAWAAIYAYSWGTIVAQLYAEESEKIAQKSQNLAEGTPSGKLLEKLILSAPVARRHKDTEQDRRAMIRANLEDIFRNYRSPPEQCSSIFEQNFERRVERAVKGTVSRSNEVFFPEGTDEFCFLSPQAISDVGNKLSEVLEGLDVEYHSMGFVLGGYQDLIKKGSLSKKFPYPQEFYAAIRRLEFMGGAEQPSLPYDDGARRLKFNAALILGYYLTFSDVILRDEDHALNPINGCKPEAPLLKGVPVMRRFPAVKDPSGTRASMGLNDDNDLKLYWHRRYCRRIDASRGELLLESANADSLRARNVFGIYDGLSRVLVGALRREYESGEVKDQCFQGKDIQDVANGTLEVNEALRTEAQKLGYDLSEEICPWAPSEHRHSTPTLILKGNADPVVAGQQAEEIFYNGLTGDRVLIEFPGVGHNMTLSDIKIENVDSNAREGNELNGGVVIATIVKGFLTSDDYREMIEEQREIHKRLQSILNIIHRDS